MSNSKPELLMLLREIQKDVIELRDIGEGCPEIEDFADNHEAKLFDPQDKILED